jgi:hypothetical protein
MLSTGDETINDLFKSSKILSSSHKILAEWNHNAYTLVSHLGSYPISIVATSRSITMTNYIGDATTTVTGTSTAAHSLLPGDFITISGATGTQQVKLNGSWKVLSVPTSSTFTFVVSSAPTSGTLTTGIGTTVNSDPTYSKTFNPSQADGGWDNGGHYHEVVSSSGNYQVEDVTRKNLTGLKEIIGPDRPDPGITFPFTIKSANTRTIISNCTNARAYNILQSPDRIYPLSETFGSKYWVSARRCKANSTRSITAEDIGVSGSTGRMKGNNAFVYYSEEVRANKIVIKTQTIHGYARDFTVEVLPAGSSTWTVIYQNTNNETMSDGILRLLRRYISGSWQWVIAGGVEEEGTITSLLRSDTTGYQSIKGIRFSVQKLADVVTNNAKEDGTLDLIEISPRMVVDMTSYTESFSSNSNLGDSTLGLPVGSIVSGSGDIKFFNQDNLISNKNYLSILENMLKPNVKFTILNSITYNSTTKYVPINILYAESWDESSDWSVSVQLEDFMGFLQDKPAPDILLGALDGIKVSAIIKILLDNAGFTRYSFNKTADLPEYLEEDRRIDFFYCKKEMSVAEALNELAKSAQLSIYFDQFGYLTVRTKEAVVQKTSSWNYTLVGDASEATSSDPEYPYINGIYSSNIESFEDSFIPPITTGEVAYSDLGIPKASLSLLNASLEKNPYTSLSKETEKTIDSGFSEITLTRDIGYIPQQVWSPNGNDGNDNDAFLSAGVIIKDIKNSRPKTILLSKTFTAKNRNDSIRLAYASMTDVEKESCEIVITQNDLIASFIGKYSGYVLVESELIRFHGIVYYIVKPGYAAEIKIYFNEAEKKSDEASAPSGSSFIPYALLVYFGMEVESFPDELAATPNAYVFYCKEDGRGSKDTEISSHTGTNKDVELDGWTSFSSKMYSSATGQTKDYGQKMTLATDVGVPDLSNLSKSTFAYGGYATLTGAPSTKTGTETDLSAEIDASEINIDDVGQQFIFGYRIPLSFSPTRVGTKMNLFKKSDAPDSVSAIGGFGFNISSTSTANTGYFIEVSSISENYDPATLGKQDNVKFYKVSNSGGTLVPTLLRSAWFPDVNTTDFERTIQYSEALHAKGDPAAKTTFSLEVAISNNKKDFRVYLNGREIMQAHDPSPLSSTNEIGLMVRDDSTAIYDYLYAVATPNGVYPTLPSSSNKENIALYSSAIEIGKNRGIFSPHIQSVLGNSVPVAYFDFGNVAREVRFIEARFNEPSFATTLIELSKVSPSYFIKDYRSTSWGASFSIYNSSSTTVPISGSLTPYPVFISGIVLKRLSSGTVDIGEYLKNIDSDTPNDQLQINRRLYGDQSINISAEYLNNQEEASILAEWIARFASQEKIEIEAKIFPNPLLQLGDKIKVFYKAKGYCYNSIGDKTYVLSQINYGATSNGIDMSVTLREML